MVFFDSSHAPVWPKWCRREEQRWQRKTTHSCRFVVDARDVSRAPGTGFQQRQKGNSSGQGLSSRGLAANRQPIVASAAAQTGSPLPLARVSEGRWDGALTGPVRRWGHMLRRCSRCPLLFPAAPPRPSFSAHLESWGLSLPPPPPPPRTGSEWLAWGLPFEPGLPWHLGWRQPGHAMACRLRGWGFSMPSTARWHISRLFQIPAGSLISCSHHHSPSRSVSSLFLPHRLSCLTSTTPVLSFPSSFLHALFWHFDSLPPMPFFCPLAGARLVTSSSSSA